MTGILDQIEACVNETAVCDWNIRSDRSKCQLNSCM